VHPLRGVALSTEPLPALPADLVVGQPLARSFYEPSARVVARALLGCWLVRRTPEGYCGGPIVETEAYLTGDPACHSFCGPTARNQVMWGQPGVAYVYFIYGNYFCFNAVCRPPGVAEAVLIRAIEAASGVELMSARRSVKKRIELTNGPGKLCLALGITRAQDGVDLCSTESPMYIAENPQLRRFRRRVGPVIETLRVGLTKAADLPLRFYLSSSPFVSRPDRRAEQRITCST